MTCTVRAVSQKSGFPEILIRIANSPGIYPRELCETWRSLLGFQCKWRLWYADFQKLRAVNLPGGAFLKSLSSECSGQKRIIFWARQQIIRRESICGIFPGYSSYQKRIPILSNSPEVDSRGPVVIPKISRHSFSKGVDLIPGILLSRGPQTIFPKRRQIDSGGIVLLQDCFGEQKCDILLQSTIIFFQKGRFIHKVYLNQLLRTLNFS